MQALRIGVAVVVTIVWAIVYVAPVYNPALPAAPAGVSGVMILVVVWLLGGAARSGLAERARRITEAMFADPAKGDEPPLGGEPE